MAQNDFGAFMKSVLGDVAQSTKQSVEQASERINQDFFMFIKNEGVEPLYKGVIDSFYNDYTPTVYDRNKSLYDMPQIIITEDYLAIEFNENRMSTFRDGGTGLYELVFKEGYHGGAKSGKDHPNPGVPYWRTGDLFSLWGKPAKRAPIAPYEDFVEQFQEFLDTQGAAKYKELWSLYTGS